MGIGEYDPDLASFSIAFLVVMDLLIPDAAPSRSPRRRVIIDATLGVGDITVLTGAVRDLHAAHPGRFAVEVRTSHPELWFYNPLLAAVPDTARPAEHVTCALRHLVVGKIPTTTRYIDLFLQDLREQLHVEVQPTRLNGDIHLSANEQLARDPVQELVGSRIPYWIVSAGGKYDAPTKWWSTERYQKVIDHYRDRILFVQVGLAAHHHPPLNGVLDLRGRTSLRELVRLVYSAQGVLCGITSLTHLAAAVPVRQQYAAPTFQRPCVVIAGGREPALLTAYPDHQVLHTGGSVTCSEGGCWKSRTKPLNDGSEFDLPQYRCIDVAGDLPRCMDLISARDVTRRIESYFLGGTLEFLQGYQIDVARRADQHRNPRGLAGWTVESPKRQAPQLSAPKRLLLLTGADAAQADVLALSGERLQTYADRHGYSCRRLAFERDPKRASYWGKIPAFLQSLNEPDWEWVMWTDADAYIANLEQRVEDLLPEGIDLLVGTDACGLNCGVFIARVCDWTRQYFSTVQFLGTAGYRDNWVGDQLEQTTMRHILKAFPEHQSHVLQTEQHVLNSYPENYRPGDFILHLSGILHEARVPIFQRLALGISPQVAISNIRRDGRF